MKTLIKWPGGKAREYNKINTLIPENIDKYIEPFFGGGGIFFKLEPKKSIINDINDKLINLYKLIKKDDVEFYDLLKQIANDWENLSLIANTVFSEIKEYKNDVKAVEIRKKIDKLRSNTTLPNLINGEREYWDLLSDYLINKLKRIDILEEKNGLFSEKDFLSQIVAAAKGTYYYYLRDKYLPKTKKENVAQFFFLREFCFGSMFRFNKEGKFNIPYGGASYNDKKFSDKVNNAFSKKVKLLFKNSSIHCEDFRAFFSRINSNISKQDFCFFDPPYDTKFSEYDLQSFGEKDQRDLASLFGKLKCRGIMIIKKTDFINKIYRDQQRQNSLISINEYGKNYSYNVRGRNKRSVTHLLILNYKPEKPMNGVQLSFQ